MPITKVMPKGGRKPSPALWAMVRGLSDDEWRQIKAFSKVYGKDSKQFRLLELLRSMTEYDPALERQGMKDSALSSMRNTARNWLLRTVARLAFYKNEVAEKVHDVDVLLHWGFHDFTLEYIAESKQLATEQEEFAWLDMLFHKEITVVKYLFEGEERSNRIQSIALRAAENAKWLLLKAQIEGMVAKHLEHGRNSLLVAGVYPPDLAKSYFKSDFYKEDIQSWPVSFQMQKLRIDEALYYFTYQVESAAKVAESMLRLEKKIEKTKKCCDGGASKVMFRLSTYYADLGKKDLLESILSGFRQADLAAMEDKAQLFKRSILSHLNGYFLFKNVTWADYAIQLWRQKSELLRMSASDTLGFNMLLLICAFFLSVGNAADARKVFTLALSYPKGFSKLAMESVFKILHIILLIEEGDERGLESFSKNYKRHLKALSSSTIASSALQIIAILSRSSIFEGQKKMNKSLRTLLTYLDELEESTEMSIKPFAIPIQSWAELRMQL